MPLGKRTDFGDARYAGLDVPFASRIEDVLGVSKTDRNKIIDCLVINIRCSLNYSNLTIKKHTVCTAECDDVRVRLHCSPTS